MIETGKQATKAVKEIQKKTDWSLRKIAERSHVSHTGIWLISKGFTKQPGADVMDCIDHLLQEVRGME